MTAFGFALVLASAALHAVWNSLMKVSEDKTAFLWCTEMACVTLFLPVYGWASDGAPIPPMGWVWIGVSGVLHYAYGLSLAAAYTAGELSFVYPLARSAPLFVPLWALVILGQVPTLLGAAGVFLIVAGAYAIGVTHVSWGALARPFRALGDRPGRFALLTAFIISFYSIVDALGVRHVDPFRFMYLMQVPWVVCLSIHLLPGRRAALAEEWRRNRWTILLVAVLLFVSYWLILVALTFAQVSYVTAVRQLSILMAVMVGVLFLGERHGRVRAAAALLMAVGAALIGWRG